MAILSQIPNGAPLRDVRDTLNSVLARLLALEQGDGTPTPAPTRSLTLSSAQSKSEGNSGTTAYVYTVALSQPAGAGGVAVPWSFQAGTTSAADYAGGVLPTGGTVNIAQGQTQGTITINVAGDAAVEPNETFTVLISTPTGYVAGAAMSATGTVINDDTSAPGPVKVLAEGDSITADVGSYSRLWSASNPTVAYSNMAQGGSTTEGGSLSLQSRKADALAYGATHMTVAIGANDMNIYASADAFLAAVFAYVAPFRAAGTKVAVATVLPRTGRTGWNARRAEVNTKLRAAVGASVDEVIDLDTCSMGADGAENDTAKYPDGLHPSSSGHAILKTVLAPVLNGMLGIANEVQDFAFEPQAAATPDTDYTSPTYTVKGLYRLESRPYSVPAGVSVSKNGGAFAAAGSGTVANGDTLRVRVRSSANAAVQVDAVLTIGTTTAAFSVTTAGAGTRDWLPTDLGAKLALWLRPEGIAGADGTDMNSWPDSSGDNVAVTGFSNGGSARPKVLGAALNGFKAVKVGAGTGGWFTAPSALIAGRTSTATFFVSKNDADPSANPGAPIGSWGAEGGDYYTFSNGGVYSGYGTNVRRDNMDPAPSLTSWRIGMFLSAPDDWRYAIDATDVGTFGSNTVAMGTAPTIGFSPGIGAIHDGSIAEVVDLRVAPTPAERRRVEGYFAWKFGLQANLPAAHPYKSAKPTI